MFHIRSFQTRLYWGPHFRPNRDVSRCILALSILIALLAARTSSSRQRSWWRLMIHPRPYISVHLLTLPESSLQPQHGGNLFGASRWSLARREAIPRAESWGLGDYPPHIQHKVSASITFQCKPTERKQFISIRFRPLYLQASLPPYASTPPPTPRSSPCFFIPTNSHENPRDSSL